MDNAGQLADIERTLEGIIDPCSAAMGLPAGLMSMGLVRSISIEGTAPNLAVSVVLCITEPGCMMGALFVGTARERIGALPSVGRVEVSLDVSHVWDRNDFAPEYRQRLARHRAAIHGGGS